MNRLEEKIHHICFQAPLSSLSFSLNLMLDKICSPEAYKTPHTLCRRSRFLTLKTLLKQSDKQENIYLNSILKYNTFILQLNNKTNLLSKCFSWNKSFNSANEIMDEELLLCPWYKQETWHKHIHSLPKANHDFKSQAVRPYDHHCLIKISLTSKILAFGFSR